jgi:hypothetical protein
MDGIKPLKPEAARALLCLAFLVGLSCSTAQKDGRAGKPTAPAESSREGILLRHSEEHNAILNWMAPLAGKKVPLTFDFQKALVRGDGHPTTFEARPLDVFLMSQRLYLLVSVAGSPRALNLVLEVPAELSERVSSLDLAGKKDLIVLADIESVDRPLPGTEEPDVLVAHGKCVALYDFDQPKPAEASKRP